MTEEYMVPLQAIIVALSNTRFDVSNEKKLQEKISEALDRYGIEHEREVNLGGGDIIDFMVGGVGIEVKLRRTSRMAIYRQLERYTEHDQVQAIILASATSMGLPPFINSKAAVFHSLSKNWL